MMKYKHALELYNVYNSEDMNTDWIHLNMQQNFNGRIDYVHIVDHSRVRVGKNNLMNRLSLINDSINYEWLNLSKDTYKIKCKEKILS